MENLSNNNRSDLQLRMDMGEYWDFFVHKGSGVCGINRWNGSRLYDRCLISYIDLTDEDCLFDKFVMSLPSYVYEDAVFGTVLKNIGLTGVDNGEIRFQKDRITNEKFLEIFTKSEMSLDTDRLRLFEVSGNTMQYVYPLSYDEKEGARLEGGFFQGFFMTECDKYQVLPSQIEDSWHFEVTLKPEDFGELNENTLNATHPGNEGFFLYIGTRAENKWIYLYDKSLVKTCSEYMDSADGYSYTEDYQRTEADYTKEINYIQREPVHPYVIDGYFTEICDNCDMQDKPSLGFIADDYLNVDNLNRAYGKYEWEKDCQETGIVKVGSCNNISDECVGYLNHGECCCPSVPYEPCTSGDCCKIPLIAWRGYFYDTDVNFIGYNEWKRNERECGIALRGEWLSDDAFDPNNEYCIVDCEYLKPDIDITNYEFETSDGIRLDLNEKIVETDNQFLVFNRTCTGYTVDNYEEGTTVAFSFPRYHSDRNYFTLMNRTCTGYTVDDAEMFMQEDYRLYDYEKDLYDNALGFRITEDGRIGYRYFIENCDTGEIEVAEFYGKPNIRKGNWYTVNIRLARVGRQMRIFIYVNGKLVLCSRNLPMLRLRELDEEYSKQEGVPYNISLGGGTQGLCEVILPNFNQRVDNVLPLEKNFAGTFIGYIRDFRFYSCMMENTGIRNNSDFDKH